MNEVRDGRKRKVFSVVAVVAVAAVAGAALLPTVGSAQSQTVKLKNGTRAGQLEVEEIGPMGLLQAEGSNGAAAVRIFAGGGGFLGAGDCDPGATATGPLPNSVQVTNAIVTGILITGDGTVTITSAAVSDPASGTQLPLARLTVNNQNPNEFVGLGNGLTVTAPLTFTGSGTGCNFVILGQ